MQQTMNQAEPKEAAQGATSAQPAGVHLYLSRRAIIALTLALVAPWVAVIAVFSVVGVSEIVEVEEAATGSSASPQVSRSRPGPWGDLQYTRIAIEPPDYFVVVPKEPPSPRWFFKGFSREQLRNFLQTLDLTDIQGVSLLQVATWTETKEGVWLAPLTELVLGLSQGARAQLYGLLALIAENRMQEKLFTFNPDYLDERLKAGNLRQDSIDLFRRLLYPHGGRLLFADADVVLPRLADEAERRRFLKMLARKNTLLVKLLITPETDVGHLVAYWSIGGRAKDLEPLLESVRWVRGSTELGIAQLLPSFARRRLYTYPDPAADPGSIRKRDLWAALNFSRRTPDDRFADIAVAGEVIRKDYYEIASDYQLGDIVALFTPANQMVTTGVYIADEIVFTMPSPSLTDPWLLVTIADWMSYWTPFFPTNQPLNVRTYRLK